MKPNKWIKPFLILLFSFASVLIFSSVLPDLSKLDHTSILVTYTLLTIIASFAPVRTITTGMTLNNAVIFSGIILYGSWVGIWSTLLDLLMFTFLMRIELPKVLYNSGQMLVTIWCVSSLNIFMSHHLSIPWMISDLVLIGVFWVLNTFFAALGVGLFRGIPILPIAKSLLEDLSMSYLLLMIVGDMGARLVESYGPLAIIPLVVTFVLIRSDFHRYFTTLTKLEYKVKEVKVLNESFLTTMAAAIDARDPYTHGHSHRVAYWGKELATALGLSKKQVDQVYYGGILHDIGKIGIEDEILNKEGKLTPEEFEKIKQHPVIGYEILEQAGVFYELLPAIRSHHERIDGVGYPDGLKGDEIPLIARILAVSDAFDAMVSNRPYRRGMPVEAALDQITQASGTQFDAELSAIFIQLIKSNLEQEVAASIQRTESLHN